MTYEEFTALAKRKITTGEYYEIVEPVYNYALFADFSTDVRDMLVEIAELVQDEEIGATSTALDEYSKCKIYKNAKGVLFITRTDTSTRQESV